MRGRELKTFILPQLVEARRKGEEDMDYSPGSMGHSSHLSRSSTLSDSTSPTTPPFSARSHSRLPSSTSSLASSPTMRESTDVFGSAKRPLTDVREEPHDRDEDDVMEDGSEGRRSYEAEVPPLTSDPEWGLYQPSASEFSAAYDFADNTVETDFAPNPCAKRRCAEDVPLSPMDGLRSRMPSFSRSLSRKFKSRKASPPTAMPDRSQEPSRSRANSTRAPSRTESIAEVAELKGVQLPPTPRRSVADDRYQDAYHALNSTSDETDALDQDNGDGVVDHQVKPTTPLLPPIMTDLPSEIREIPYQSPLQSPSVASPDVASAFNSPLPTPRIAGLPSPPLSSRPSVSSFHPQRGVAPISPTAEIPPMSIYGPDDKWADQLGHANFTIYPEPYISEDMTLMACKQLRADWETARLKYLKYLACTGENYGATSKIYRLTEEKWAEIDTVWKSNVEFSFSRIPKLAHGNDAVTTGLHADGSATFEKPAPLMKVSSADGPRNDCKFITLGKGKFPAIGDEDIVGPMEVVAPQEPQRRKRKLGFFRWVSGVWPAGAASLTRRSSAGH